MKDFFENPAIISFISAIIGGLLTTAGSIILEHFKLKKEKLKQQYSKETESRKIKENLFKEYLTILNKYRQFYFLKAFNLNNMNEDEVKALCNDATRITSEIDLFASEDISKACHKLIDHLLQITFNNEKFNKIYDEIIEMMKKELDNNAPKQQ